MAPPPPSPKSHHGSKPEYIDAIPHRIPARFPRISEIPKPQHVREDGRKWIPRYQHLHGEWEFAKSFRVLSEVARSFRISRGRQNPNISTTTAKRKLRLVYGDGRGRIPRYQHLRKEWGFPKSPHVFPDFALSSRIPREVRNSGISESLNSQEIQVGRAPYGETWKDLEIFEILTDLARFGKI